VAQSSNPLVRSEPTVSRRTVVAGIAWSVPVIAIATATPAFAASPGIGPITVLPTTVTHTGGTLTQSAYTGFLPTGSAAGHATGSYLTGSPVANSFTSGSDTNGSAATVTAFYTFNAVQAAKYSVAVKVLTQYGNANGSTGYSERQSVDVTVTQGGTSVSVAKVSVSHPTRNQASRSDSTLTRAGYTLQAPSAGTKDYGPVTFTAPSTGAVTVTFVFTLDARRSGNSVNDDIWVSAPVVTRIS
jgi:hypothetical protein